MSVTEWAYLAYLVGVLTGVVGVAFLILAKGRGF